MVQPAKAKAEKKYTITVNLPVCKQSFEISRVSWGDRLELDDRCTNQLTGKIDWRNLHAMLAERSTLGAMNMKDYFELDPTDGYILRKEVLLVNSIDPAFLETSSDLQKDSTSEQDSNQTT